MSLTRTLPIVIISMIMTMFLSSAWAATAGTVTHVSGPLSARKAGGAITVLAINSSVDSGDILITEKRTYARIKFIDNSEITLKPNTQFKIEEFGYNKDKPGDDKAVYSLVRGGLRAVTGQIGKRSEPESYKIKTPTATIGVRGTIFTADYIEDVQRAEGPMVPVMLAMADTLAASDAIPMLVADVTPTNLAPGLYVHVIDGLVQLSNRGGIQQFSAGQFGFTGSVVQPPVVVPNNPGIQFNPPPGFSATPRGGGNSGGTQNKGVDCEVR